MIHQMTFIQCKSWLSLSRIRLKEWQFTNLSSHLILGIKGWLTTVSNRYLNENFNIENNPLLCRFKVFGYVSPATQNSNLFVRGRNNRRSDCSSSALENSLFQKAATRRWIVRFYKCKEQNSIEYRRGQRIHKNVGLRAAARRVDLVHFRKYLALFYLWRSSLFWTFSKATSLVPQNCLSLRALPNSSAPRDLWNSRISPAHSTHRICPY